MNLPLGHQTPTALMTNYPRVNYLKWDAVKVGIFLSGSLLSGSRLGKHRTAYISEESFMELADYGFGILHRSTELLNPDIDIPNSELSTPSELFEDNKRVQYIGWNAAKIGTYFESTLLLGTRSGSDHKAKILESSFWELIDFAAKVRRNANRH